jgi:hypothetical protein
MNGLIQAIALGAIRNGVMALGGWFLQHGYATNSQATSLEGSLIFLAGFAFSVYDKFKVHNQVSGNVNALGKP